MKQNTRKKRLLSIVICFILVFSMLSTATFAAEYPYQYPSEKNYYQMSMYAYKVNASDAESYPTGIFRLLSADEQNIYAYCADSDIYDVPGTAYQAIALSDYYDGTTTQADKLRSIIQNSYPFITMDEMIARIEQSGIELHNESVPCYEMVLISAIQQAIYSYTNPDTIIEVHCAGEFPQNIYESFKPYIYQYNDEYNNSRVSEADSDIKADVQAVYTWLCGLDDAAAPSVTNVTASFAAEAEQEDEGYLLILDELFTGFENYKDIMTVSVKEIVGESENLLLEKPFKDFTDIGQGRYQTELPDTITGNKLKVTLSGYSDYEEVLIYEAEETDQEPSQPFIGKENIRVPFSQTEQIELPQTTGTLIIQKTVSGSGASTSKDFTFTVTLMQNGVALANDVTYGGVTFTNGAATFTLKHNESKTIAGIPADLTYLVEESNNSGYTVRVNDTNETTASGSITAGETVSIVFNNYRSGGGGGIIITPSPAKVSLTAEKLLDGAVPADGSFKFVLRNEDGKNVQTKSNDGDEITFDTLSFSSTGTYEYTIEEVAGNDDSINYDDTVYTAVITVIKPNNYYAEVAYEKNGAAYRGTPIFKNTTKTIPPVIEQDEEKQTDDTENTPAAIIPADDLLSVSVNKLWQDSGADKRPGEALVQLYCDGKAYGEAVSLSAGNNWSYTWDKLDNGHTWAVDEVNVPEGYTKSIAKNGNVWTITNAKALDNVPPTGDNSHNSQWIVLAALALTVLILTIYGKKRLSLRRKC